MPAALPYSWTQTDATLEVSVHLRHADRRRPEVQVSRAHLQINSPPQLLVLDLYDSVDPDASCVRVGSDGVTFALRKVGLSSRQTGHLRFRVLLGPVTYNPCSLFRQRKELGLNCCAQPPDTSCLHAVWQLLKKAAQNAGLQRLPDRPRSARR